MQDYQIRTMTVLQKSLLCPEHSRVLRINIRLLLHVTGNTKQMYIEFWQLNKTQTFLTYTKFPTAITKYESD